MNNVIIVSSLYEEQNEKVLADLINEFEEKSINCCFWTPYNDDLNDINIHNGIDSKEIKNWCKQIMSQITEQDIDEILGGKDSNWRYGRGIYNLVSLMAATLQIKENGILVVKYPETYLHPSSQRKLNEFFVSVAKSKRCSVVVVTYSEHLFNGFRLSVKKKIIQSSEIEIIYSGTNNSIYKPNILEDGRLDYWPEGFFDEWEKALYELI